MIRLYLHKTLLIIFSLSLFLHGSDNRRLAMGNMQISLPDVFNQFNIWQVTANPAGLLASDSLNWMFYSANHLRRGYEVRRWWDAKELASTNLIFSGQKRLGRNQMFYGYFRYGWENHFDLRRSIDQHPYDLDPFVLADSTEGNFNFYGPEIYAVYNYHFTNGFSIGTAIRYNIRQGLKTIFTRPEIIHRRFDVDLAVSYALNNNFTIGFTFSYFDRQDLTKLVTQPDKREPITYRYRGEFEYKSITGKGDRIADYDGYIMTPSVQWQTTRWEGIIFAGYFYRWHELYDNPTLPVYDGYYQEQRYFTRLANRYYLNAARQTLFAVDGYFGYIENWAKEPHAGYMIYRAFYHRYGLTLGFSHQFDDIPLTVAAEGEFKRDLPDRRDYLAHVYRVGTLDDTELRFGGEYTVAHIYHIRAGFYYHWYEEDPVWKYFGNMSGPGATAGFGYDSEFHAIDFYFKYGGLSSCGCSAQNSGKRNNSLDIVLSWKQFF